MICDRCPQKARIQVTLPVGVLIFCQHHYDYHAEAIYDLIESYQPSSTELELPE